MNTGTADPTAADSLTPTVVVAGNVRKYRTIHEMTQADLAAEMRYLGHSWTGNTVGFVERAERQVSTDEFVSLAVVFGATVGELLSSTGPGGLVGRGLDFGSPERMVPEVATSWAKGRIRIQSSRHKPGEFLVSTTGDAVMPVRSTGSDLLAATTQVLAGRKPNS